MITRPAGDDEPVLNVTPFTHSFNFLNPTRRRHLPLSETPIFPPMPRRDFHVEKRQRLRGTHARRRITPITSPNIARNVLMIACLLSSAWDFHARSISSRKREREISRDTSVGARIVILISDASRKMITYYEVLYGARPDVPSM